MNISFLRRCWRHLSSGGLRCAVLGLFFLCPPALAASAQVWAYHAHWMRHVWTQYDLGKFQRVLFFDVEADPEGRLKRNGWPEQWLELRRACQTQRVPLDPVVTLLGKANFSAIFSRPEASHRLLDEITSLLKETPESGIHLDIEVFDAVPEAEAASFRQFLAKLRQSMQTPRKRTLTAFVPLASGLYGPDEYALLDGIVVQGYDAHWAEGPKSGPVSLLEEEGSSVAWKQAGGKLTQAGVARERIFFSSPLFGYEWPTETDAPRAPTRGAGRTITFAPVSSALLPDLRGNALMRALQYGLRREAETGSPWYAFRGPDGWRQGWFDDPVSLKPRLEFVRQNGFGGVAFFALGYDSGVLIEAALAAFSAEKSAGAGGAAPPPDP